MCTTTFPLLSNAASIDTKVIVTVSGHFACVAVGLGAADVVGWVAAALVVGAATELLVAAATELLVTDTSALLVDVDAAAPLEAVDAVVVAELVLASAAWAPSARRKLVAITAVVLRTAGRRKQKSRNLVPVMRPPSDAEKLPTLSNTYQTSSTAVGIP
jgi:hypothetical protein